MLSVVLVAGLGGLLWSPARTPEPLPLQPPKPVSRPSEARVRPTPNSSKPTPPGPCHDEKLTAAEIELSFVEGVAPTVDGGELSSGVYDAVRYEVFGDIPEKTLARTFRQTIVVDAEHSIMKTVRQDQHDRVETWIWAIETDGATLSMTARCPAGLAGAGESLRYGMRGRDLITAFEQAGVPVIVTYRRRVG